MGTEVIKTMKKLKIYLDTSVINFLFANDVPEEKVIPPQKIEDAQHIAISTCNQIEILLSWNFKHLANIQKQIYVKIVNEKEGYFYPLILTNPMEVIYEKNGDGSDTLGK